MSVEAFVRAFHAHRASNPNVRVQLGIDRALGELPDPSLEWSRQHEQGARRLLGELRRVQSSALLFSDRLDLELAQLMLDSEVFELGLALDGEPTLSRQPRAGDEVGDGIFMLAVADPRPAAERLEDITRRIEGIPAYLEGMLARLQRPVERWVEMDVAKVVELPSLLASMQAWAEAERWSGGEWLNEVSAPASAALHAYAERLQALPTTSHFHVGPSAAARIVALRGIEQSLDELHAMARTFLADTQRELDALQARLIAKYALPSQTTRVELHQFLNRRFRVQIEPGRFDQVLTRYRREQDQLLRYIRERDLFPIPEGQSLQILETPGFMRPSIPAGAMAPPAPFRQTAATSLIFLTLSEELLDEHTELTIPVMMIHEGIPGHHLQLSTAAQHPSWIRRHVSANDHAEGWTTMLEDYMLDIGYMADLADEARFCTKRDLSRIGARVAIDLFFMTGERDYLDVGLGLERGQPDPFVAAGELLAAVTGFTPGRVHAELSWYSLERGYPLSYLTGYRLVERLRADVHAAHRAGGLGPDRGELDASGVDRLFFERYLSSGNMPLAFLRRVFREEGLVSSETSP